ncbi:hypothetical protein GCM10028801_15920 [Nocardioides maradonensis]
MARRPKHDPQESAREILDAAEDFLRDHAFRELTVEAVMSRTGLKRPAFYVHFRDRHDLTLRVVEDVAQEVAALNEQWLASDHFSAASREAIRGMVDVFVRHGHVLRALADAAASDAAVEAAYTAVVDGFVETSYKRIVAEQAEGRIRADLDAEETARALVSMDERYMTRALTAEPVTDPDRVADVLFQIWSATLYGVVPETAETSME